MHTTYNTGRIAAAIAVAVGLTLAPAADASTLKKKPTSSSVTLKKKPTGSSLTLKKKPTSSSVTIKIRKCTLKEVTSKKGPKTNCNWENEMLFNAKQKKVITLPDLTVHSYRSAGYR